MKRLELYFIRAALITLLMVIAFSPIAAIGYFFEGVASLTLQATHLLALGYLLLIAFCAFLLSPVFGENKS